MKQIFITLLFTISTLAYSAEPKSLVCRDILYVPNTEVEIDLETLSFRVVSGLDQELLGEGMVSAISDEDDLGYRTFHLYEEGKYVGFLKAIHNSGPRTKKSYFYYKGKTRGGEYPALTFVCFFESSETTDQSPL